MKVLLVGNYPPDRQESMRRYADLLLAGVSASGHDATLMLPHAYLNRDSAEASGLRKWVGYVDKYLLSRPALARAVSSADVVHICDHANSIYVPTSNRVPHVVTCHDLLAVRGALGEQTDCPASAAGKLLQASILRGLKRAQALACVSTATFRDARRLLPDYRGRIIQAPNALNYPYGVLADGVAEERLPAALRRGGARPFVLNVGSNLRRKNREGVLHAIASISQTWSGAIVFAGEPLSAPLRSLARDLGVVDRVIEVIKPSDRELEALYNRAAALLFASRFEGFGWPIIEAQACGCPVICSDREPMSEVAGGAALLRDVDDSRGFGQAIVELDSRADLQASLKQRGLENARRYDSARMIERFIELYQSLVSA